MTMLATMVRESTDARAMLTDLYWAAVEAAAPGPALKMALDRIAEPRARVWVIAIGKAAQPMATAAVEALRKRRMVPAGGIIVDTQVAIPPHPSLTVVVGNHPLPGPRSFAAAARIGDIAARVRDDDEVWVLLSGGASSLAGAPEGAIKPDELVALYRLLHGVGADIATMNTVRKRFGRWGAGRLAYALSPARIRCYAVSDVIGDDLTMIGSGPCVPDPSSAAEVMGILRSLAIWDRVPLSMRRYLMAVERDAELETPKPGDSVFWEVEKRVIASNRASLAAAASRAAGYGYPAQIVSANVAGDAVAAARRVVAALLHRDAPGSLASGRSARACLIWGGETTVRLGDGAGGVGGRCQELALAAARELAAAGDSAEGVTLLAAGTDGRDGVTDAAGAIVDAHTWSAISGRGRDPERDLLSHDSHPALDSAGCLFRTGATGTNVMDVLIAVRA